MRATRRILASLVTLAFLLSTAGMAFADNSKISPDLQPLLSNPNNNIDVIIQYNTPPQTCTNNGLLGGLICTTVNLLGGVLHTVFGLLNAVSATLTPADVIAAANQSNVTYISPNRTVNAAMDYSVAAADASPALVGGFDGTGIGVAVIDSGIYPHPDLNFAGSTRSRIVYRASSAALCLTISATALTLPASSQAMGNRRICPAQRMCCVVWRPTPICSICACSMPMARRTTRP